MKKLLAFFFRFGNFFKLSEKICLVKLYHKLSSNNFSEIKNDSLSSKNVSNFLNYTKKSKEITENF